MEYSVPFDEIGFGLSLGIAWSFGRFGHVVVLHVLL
jgi:hypothetical protein